MSALLSTDPPVAPDREEARDWLITELTGPEYAAAQPTWFDLLVQSILDWLAQLTVPVGEGGFPWWIVVLVVLVIIIVIIAIRIVGLPRLRRRRDAAGSLFGDDDRRDAAAMRREAARAATNGDYTTAVAELYRAVARDLDERTLVSVLPGTTAQGFARDAGTVFPTESAALAASAADFDAVRYLGATGTAEQWQRILGLDGRLRAARPQLTGAGR